jgi:hypothetical protein
VGIKVGGGVESDIEKDVVLDGEEVVGSVQGAKRVCVGCVMVTGRSIVMGTWTVVRPAYREPISVETVRINGLK